MPIDDFNKNLFAPTRFAFTLSRLPSFEFFVQSVVLPGPSISVVEQMNPFRPVQRVGDHITYGELQAEFLVNEDLTNWVSLYDWISKLSISESYAQYNDIKDQLTSDATINVLDSAGNPQIRIQIEDLFPISLTDITFDSKDTNETPVVCTASFAFQTYRFVYIN